MKLKFKTALLVAVAACSSVASAITQDFLQNLVDTNGSLSIGDKTFSGFGYLASNLADFNPSNIKVEAKQIGSTYFLSWTGNISVAGTGLVTGDLALSYTVTASAGIITEIDQRYAGNVVNGIGAVAISEIVANSKGLGVGNSNLSLGDIVDDAWNVEGDDELVLKYGGDSVLYVVKDIALAVLANQGQLGFASISYVEQSFHQENRVPDGGSAVALLGIALVGLQGLRRKMR
jgi:hypothetical protein